MRSRARSSSPSIAANCASCFQIIALFSICTRFGAESASSLGFFPRLRPAIPRALICPDNPFFISNISHARVQGAAGQGILIPDRINLGRKCPAPVGELAEYHARTCRSGANFTFAGRSKSGTTSQVLRCTLGVRPGQTRPRHFVAGVAAVPQKPPRPPTLVGTEMGQDSTSKRTLRHVC